MPLSKLLDNYLSDLKGSNSRKGSDVFVNIIHLLGLAPTFSSFGCILQYVRPFAHWAASVVNHVTSYQIWHIVVFQNN